jgi:hypothetical protein
MTATRSVPRILQRPAVSHAPSRPPSGIHMPGEGRQKGDLRTQVEVPQPSREREPGDLESAEREAHARALHTP